MVGPCGAAQLVQVLLDSPLVVASMITWPSVTQCLAVALLGLPVVLQWQNNDGMTLQ